MAQPSLLVVNAGSSSLKFHLYGIDTSTSTPNLGFRFGGQMSGIGTDIAAVSIKNAQGVALLSEQVAPEQVGSLQQAQHYLAAWLATQVETPPVAVGHRIVHGGAKLHESAVIDDGVLAYLEGLAPLAPLHQHNNLSPVYVVREHWPQMLQVACVDTAFHRTQSAMVGHYALPRRFYDQGVRRYGFHGLSYQYISDYFAEHHPTEHEGRVLVAHLGSGASACMMVNGKSQESTMGFTALDGLPMATRPGHLDAGVVLWWMQQQQMSASEIQDLLYNQSGLKGLSGRSGDMRELLNSDCPDAQLAVDYYCYRVAEGLTKLCVATQGVDSIVFTAGVGEHSAEVRARILQYLHWLGVRIDQDANRHNAQRISAVDSQVALWVIPTNEELVIARETLRHYLAQQEAHA